MTKSDDNYRQFWDRVAKWAPTVLAAARFIFDLVHRIHG